MKSSFFQKSKHLPQSRLMSPDEACPFCSSADRTNVALLQREPDIYLYSCRNCYAASASRMPTQEALEEYYRSYYEDREYYRERGIKVTIDIPEKLAVHIFSRVHDALSHEKTIHILDFGGGNGEISLRLAKRLLASGTKAVKIAVVDYTEDLLPAGDSRIEMAHYKTLPLVRNFNYEIVIASAIIEHIPSPIQAMGGLFSVLRSGGIFYARTPYVLPFLKIFTFFGLKFDFQYPGHIHDLGGQFWNNIFSKLPIKGNYDFLASNPSLVETSFREHFVRTLMAYTLKAPWYLFKGGYNLVGGWEVFIRKK